MGENSYNILLNRRKRLQTYRVCPNFAKKKFFYMYVLVPKIPEVITKCLPLSNKVNGDFFFSFLEIYVTFAKKTTMKKIFTKDKNISKKTWSH